MGKIQSGGKKTTARYDGFIQLSEGLSCRRWGRIVQKTTIQETMDINDKAVLDFSWKIFLAVRAVQQRNGLPLEVMDSPLLKVFKQRWDSQPIKYCIELITGSHSDQTHHILACGL